jgi:hypothetical protein
MTDPTQAAADQIGQMAQTIQGQPVSEQELAQRAQAAAGLGVTGVDIDELAATIAAMQAQIADLNAAKAAAAGNPLADTTKTINYFLAGHGDPVAVELGKDLAAAVEEAGQSGDTAAVAQIAARLDRHLAKNAPYPGENYHYRNAVAFTSDLPEIIYTFKPAPAPAGSNLPAKVVAGSVIG